uniref:F-box protein 30b n=1 Tax=Eptatretus burgeri TaxID=7764 RepID=A0A8C4RDI9_EPTBU
VEEEKQRETQYHVHCAHCVMRRCKARLGTGGICEVRPCPAACGALFHTCKGNEHRQLCPLERVPCPNAGYGCPLWMHRCAVGAHIRVCPASVVCCTMEWNRWPQQFQDPGHEEEHDATEQLDMALALRDQKILLESLRVSPARNILEDRSERGQDVLHDSFHRITVNEAALVAEDVKGGHENVDKNDCDRHKEKVLDVGQPMVMETASDTMHQEWMNEEGSRSNTRSDLVITRQEEQQKSTNSPMNECNKHLLPRFPLPDSFRRSVLGDVCWSLHKVEEKAVDTIELEKKYSQNDGDPDLDMSGIDLVTAALLFCLDSSSPRGRSISDRHVSLDGLHVDVSTQTFSAPSAMLATRTVVGEMASASACDHANPQLSNPSPFPRLGLNLVLECVERYRARQRSMFTFVCGQLFRRDEYPHHFKNVHGDIHAGLNGWLEQRCPLAQYGCSYTQLRFCPGSMPGSRVVYSTLLRSFGVQPFVAAELEKSARPVSLDLMSRLPFVVLRNVARFLDGYSLCQLSRVSRLMREVCGSLLAERGMVELVWNRHAEEAGKISWKVSHKVWHFSTSFSPVSLWKFADVPNMADHLRHCRYNMVERRIEAVPMPCMCGPRQRRKKGRLLKPPSCDP